MILITGATGKLGQHVVEQLLAKVPAKDIAIAVRDPKKAAAFASRGIDVRKADYDAPESWDKALAGVDRVLLISGNEMGKRERQHKVVVDAAKRARVKLLAYTSILHADTSKLFLAKEHLATEAHIQASGLPYALLRNGWYHENYSENLAAALQHGVLAGAAGEGRFHAAARADYAAAAVAVLLAPVKGNAIHELAGDSGFTLTQLAATVSRLAGKPVAYKDMPEKAYQEFLQGVGVPEPMAHMLADSDAQAAKGDLADTSGALHRLIGRAPGTLEAAIEAGLKAGPAQRHA